MAQIQTLEIAYFESLISGGFDIETAIEIFCENE